MSKILPPVLSAKELDHLLSHKYVAGTYTALDLAINPAWLSLCELLPTWLAPNLVTITGFIPLGLNYCAMWQFAPHFSEPVPRAVAFATALSILFYQTMDALDGKQARRTGSASPIGQLFDHGVDTLAVICFHSAISLVLLPGPTKLAIISLCFPQTVMFLGQWCEQHTGVLLTAVGNCGVTETQLLFMTVVLLSTIFEPAQFVEVMNARPFGTTGLAEIITVKVLATAALYVGLFYITVNIVSCALREATNKGGIYQVGLAVTQTFPVLLTNLVAAFAWEDELYTTKIRMLSFGTGLLLFYFTIQMIVSTMSSMKFCIFQFPTLIPYSMLAVSSRYLHGPLFEHVLDASVVFLALWISLWIYRVLGESTSKLGIELFTIKHSQKTQKTN